MAGNTTLPNYDVLDKVYPGWRNLVADGTINRFMEIEIKGALKTKMFGISGKSNATISSIPGLATIFNQSNFSQFTLAMAEAFGHRLVKGKSGYFGTMVPTVSVPENGRFGLGVYRDSLYNDSLGMFANLNLSSFDEGVEACGSWAAGAYSYEAGTTYDPIGDDKVLDNGRILRILPGSSLHGDIINRISGLIDKHNLLLVYNVPMIMSCGNLANDDAYKMHLNGPMHSLCLPGLKPVVFWFDGLESNVGSVSTFNNTIMLTVYVEDNGTNSIFGFRFQESTGCYAQLMQDDRYVASSDRVAESNFHARGADLVAVFGPTITVKGTKYTLASVSDGIGSGPKITDVGGTYSLSSAGFIPLLGIPGRMNYLFMGDVSESIEDSYLVDGKEVYVSSTVVDCTEYLLKYDYSWYENYYLTGFDVYTPRNSNIQKNTLDSWAAIKEYNLAVYGCKTSYSLTESDVKRTNLYRKYKKAQDKACREDKFMTLPFDDKHTYSQMLAKSKPSNCFMNLVGGSQITEVPFKFETGRIEMRDGTPTFIPAGGESEILTDERYVELALQGVTRVDEVEVALDVVKANLDIQLKDRDVNTNVSLTSFTGKDDRYLWMDKEGAMINGYPIISAMTADQRMVALGLNAAQFNSMLQPTVRLIESLTSDKMWIRFK